MQTKGQYRVGSTFNPSGNDTVAQIKAKAAERIDLIDTIHSDRTSDLGNEVGRLKALAQTAIEDGSMWAVKAATKPERV